MQIEAWIYFPGTDCDICGERMLTPVVDVGFGLDKGMPVGPSKCEKCGSVTKDCQAKVCGEEQCGCFDYCVGMALEGR